MAATKSSNTFGNMPHRNGTYLGNYAAGITLDVTPDLHLKMSKKIAQLTKVVYTLNTRNDEHDCILESLKEQHEEEVQQLLSETRTRINSSQKRIENTEKLNKDIEVLEERLEAEQGKRKEVVDEFERFRITSMRREENLSNECERKIKTSCEELLKARNTFDEYLKSFKEARRVLEQDKDNAVEDLVRSHHDELDQLMKAHRVRYDEVIKEKEKIRVECDRKLKDLSVSPETFRAEREKLESEHQVKLGRLKGFYEKELSLAKETIAKGESLAKLNQQKEKDLKSSWGNQEKQYKDRISILRKELDRSKDLVLDLEGRLMKVEKEASSKTESIDEVQRRLDNALKNVSELTKKLRTTKDEMEVAQKRCEELTGELSVKSCKYV